MQIKFIAGPHDGLALDSRLGASFLWTDGKRCYRAPGRGRSLYRSAAGVYRFVGHTHGMCVCGVFRRRRPSRCGMCGEEKFVG